MNYFFSSPLMGDSNLIDCFKFSFIEQYSRLLFIFLYKMVSYYTIVTDRSFNPVKDLWLGKLNSTNYLIFLKHIPIFWGNHFIFTHLFTNIFISYIYSLHVLDLLIAFNLNQNQIFQFNQISWVFWFFSLLSFFYCFISLYFFYLFIYYIKLLSFYFFNITYFKNIFRLYFFILYFFSLN